MSEASSISKLSVHCSMMTNSIPRYRLSGPSRERPYIDRTYVFPTLNFRSSTMPPLRSQSSQQTHKGTRPFHCNLGAESQLLPIHSPATRLDLGVPSGEEYSAFGESDLSDKIIGQQLIARAKTRFKQNEGRTVYVVAWCGVSLILRIESYPTNIFVRVLFPPHRNIHQYSQNALCLQGRSTHCLTTLVYLKHFSRK